MATENEIYQSAIKEINRIARTHYDAPEGIRSRQIKALVWFLVREGVIKGEHEQEATDGNNS